MNFPVLVEATNGHFTATVAGIPTMSTVDATREAAVASLTNLLEQRIEQGELLSVELPARKSVLDLAGKYADDPTLRELCEEAYRLRDNEPFAHETISEAQSLAEKAQ